PGLHVRLEDGDRRDAQVEGGGVHARVAQPDRDGPGDEEEGGRDVEGAGDRTMKATLREGQTFAGESLLVRYVNFVKLPHTVFALLFALLGLLVASREYRVTWRVRGLVVLAFTRARFVALGFNRIPDLELEASDPRPRVGDVAATGRCRDPWWTLVAGAAAVTFWVGGFDVFYARQDEQFARRERVKSLVVRFGPAAAIVAAKVLHGLAVVALVAFGLG